MGYNDMIRVYFQSGRKFLLREVRSHLAFHTCLILSLLQSKFVHLEFPL